MEYYRRVKVITNGSIDFNMDDRRLSQGNRDHDKLIVGFGRSLHVL